MVDLGVAVYWDPPTAISRVRAFAEYGLSWIEEPLGPWDPEGYRRLRAAVDTAIAWGEREWDARGYDEVLDTGCVDVVGCRSRTRPRDHRLPADRRPGGGARRQLNAHAWSSAIVSAASLAASFASPAAKLFELKPLPNPMQDELVERAHHPPRRLDAAADGSRAGHRGPGRCGRALPAGPMIACRRGV